MLKIPYIIILSSVVLLFGVLADAQPYRDPQTPEDELDKTLRSMVIGDAGWSPNAPAMPTEYDWVQLSSGEWLKGELISMYREELEFDSDELGLLVLDWDDIAVARTHIRKSLRFENGRIVDGLVLVEGSLVRLINDTEIDTFERGALISIAASGKRGWNLWSGNISFGGNMREGNTEQQDYNFDFDVQRRTSSSRLQFKLLSSFSLTQSVETENNHRANINGDWFISNRWFLRPIALEAYRDKFQNIDVRVSYSFRPGYFIIDNKRTSWSVNTGAGYQLTRFITVEAGKEDKKQNPVYALGTDFEIEITKDIDFELYWDFQSVGKDAGGYLQHLETGLDIELISDFDLTVKFIWDNVSDPVASEDTLPEKTDTRLVVGIGYEF
ncbi:Putative salt-induced outer membrane protein YdiY [Alteromonadaceae bacterium Bs31]|nr:Putative salt-induced outer membrane protein YdiY [Alteromonadaceae bacterium Bs31]